MIHNHAIFFASSNELDNLSWALETHESITHIFINRDDSLGMLTAEFYSDEVPFGFYDQHRMKLDWATWHDPFTNTYGEYDPTLGPSTFTADHAPKGLRKKYDEIHA